jgi:alkylation response protein AidB-like acyl-CoA dehydrogenase/putative sterol carrier protein
MKSLYFTEDHEIFRQSVKQFVQNEVVQNIEKWEEEEQIPKTIWKKMGELGFLGINFPDEFGGTNNDFFYSVILLDEIARSGCAGLAAAHGVHQYMSTAHILKAGSDELKKKYLPGAIDGSLLGALAISEPGAGSDVANLRTTAVRQGDHYVINGQKTFITNGVYGDFVTVACKTKPDAGTSGISLIVVDQKTPGFTTRKLKKIGWRSSDTGELFFENVKVPVSNLIGNENQGFYYIMESFQLERLVAGISAVYGAEQGLNITYKYISEREAFGRPISKFQTLRHRLVDLATELEAARQLTLYTAWLFDKGEVAVKECSMVKMLTTELAKKVADECLQCFGGYGYMEEYPIARMYRDVRVGTIVGGTSEIMREILSKIIIDDVRYSSAYASIKSNGNATEKTFNTNFDKKLKTETTMEGTPQTAAEIIRSLPNRFRPEKAEGFDAVFHFDIAGNNGGQYTVEIKNQTCQVHIGFQGEATCRVTAQDSVYEDVELGRTNPQMAVMMGKIKMNNLGAMMKFAGLFNRLPSAN